MECVFNDVLSCHASMVKEIVKYIGISTIQYLYSLNNYKYNSSEGVELLTALVKIITMFCFVYCK